MHSLISIAIDLHLECIGLAYLLLVAALFQAVGRQVYHWRLYGTDWLDYCALKADPTAIGECGKRKRQHSSQQQEREVTVKCGFHK
ncbi:hypothetical protein PQR62_03890 [Herbaspirillum lusitanum]|uniref:Secreted protein n=1 Tax=Herbaspirillum lusitanum TaxID=213312 RepID=A0ABW9A4N9_9BURK